MLRRCLRAAGDPGVRRRLRLKQGILPSDWCARELPARRSLPSGPLRILPLRSYRYDEAEAVVAPGQRVTPGQALSRPQGLLSRVRLAPCGGTVRAVEHRVLENGALVPCVLLEPDDQPAHPLEPALALSALGLENGSGLPLDLELDLLPAGGLLVLNGAETELGHWSLMAHLEELAAGADGEAALDLLLQRIRPSRIGLAYRRAQGRAGKALAERLAPRITVTRLELDDSHPGAHPRLLAEQALARRGRPLATDRPLAAQGVLVLDLDRLRLLQQRLVRGPEDRFLLSLSDLEGRGELVDLPAGLPLEALFGGAVPDLVFAGGALSGRLLRDTDSPLLPPLRSLVCVTGEPPRHREQACITCGRCLEACPRQLAPPRLAHLVEEGRLAEALGMGLDHCLHCGVCTFVCPSRINLAHSLAKGVHLLGEGRHVSA